MVSDIHSRLVGVQARLRTQPPSSASARRARFLPRQGRGLNPKDRDIKPLTHPARSSVYRSKTDGKLKVAFSVPIHGGGKRDSKVIGVLAMA